MSFALLTLSSAFPIVMVSRILDGSSAGNVAMCYASVMDSGSEDERRQGIAALGAAVGGGFIAGLGLSAFLAGYGFRSVALAALLLSLLSLALVMVAVPETRHGPSLSFKIVEALKLQEVRRAVVFVALCAALQAAFVLTLPVYLASALGLRSQATIVRIALLIVVAAAFQLTALPRLLRVLGITVTARLLLVVALCTAVFVGVNASGAVAVLLSAALLTSAAASLSPVGTLFLAESYPSVPVGLTMGLNTSAATGGQIVGPIIGYVAYTLGGSQALGLSCVALALCAAGTLGIRTWLKIKQTPDQ